MSCGLLLYLFCCWVCWFVLFVARLVLRCGFAANPLLCLLSVGFLVCLGTFDLLVCLVYCSFVCFSCFFILLISWSACSACMLVLDWSAWRDTWCTILPYECMYCRMSVLPYAKQTCYPVSCKYRVYSVGCSVVIVNTEPWCNKRMDDRFINDVPCRPLFDHVNSCYIRFASYHVTGSSCPVSTARTSFPVSSVSHVCWCLSSCVGFWALLAPFAIYWLVVYNFLGIQSISWSIYVHRICFALVLFFVLSILYVCWLLVSNLYSELFSACLGHCRFL